MFAWNLVSVSMYIRWNLLFLALSLLKVLLISIIHFYCYLKTFKVIFYSTRIRKSSWHACFRELTIEWVWVENYLQNHIANVTIWFLEHISIFMKWLRNVYDFLKNSFCNFNTEESCFFPLLFIAFQVTGASILWSKGQIALFARDSN